MASERCVCPCHTHSGTYPPPCSYCGHDTREGRWVGGYRGWCEGPPRRNPLHLDRAAIADATGYTPGSLDNLLDRHRLTQVEVLAPAWAIWNGKTRQIRWV